LSTEATIGSVANKFAYGGAAGTILAGISGADLITCIGGLTIGVAGFLVSLYYKRKADARAAATAAAVERREAEEHAARMRLYAQGIDPRE
jgi:hypothetical protein